MASYWKCIVLVVLLAGVVPGVSGCYFPPPFDLTGTYKAMAAGRKCLAEQTPG